MTVVVFQNEFGIVRYSGGRKWVERKDRWKEHWVFVVTWAWPILQDIFREQNATLVYWEIIFFVTRAHISEWQKNWIILWWHSVFWLKMASLNANVSSLQLFARANSLSGMQFASLVNDLLIFIQRSLISSRSLRWDSHFTIYFYLLT